MSNDLSSSDPVNPPTVPQRSAAIVNPDGRWALYHETIDSPDIPETSYYLLELGTGITTKLPKSAESAPPGSTLTNFIWADKITLFCQAQMNQITYFFTLRGPQFALHLANAGHVSTLMTISKAIHVLCGNNKTRKIYVAIAVSGIGTGTTSARPSASEVDSLGYSSRPGGQILRCLVFKIQEILPYISIEDISGDILETINLRYVPFPTQVSMGPRNFDISTKGLAFVAQTEEQSQAQHDSISDVYFIPFDQLPTPKKLKELIPIRMKTIGITGSASVPVLSPSGPFWLAFLKRNDNSTERGEMFIFKVIVYPTESYHPQRIFVSAEEIYFAPNPANLAWAGPSQSISSRKLFYWVDSQMTIVEILIPIRNTSSPLVCTWVVTGFDHGGSILGIDCLNKSRLHVDDPRLLISRASANGRTDFLIYNADTGDRSMVQCAPIGEVMTEQNQDNSNETGGNFGDLTEDGIIEDGITENREEVSQESDDIDGIFEYEIIEDEIIDDKIIDNRGVGDDSDGIEDKVIEDGFIEDMIAEHRVVEDTAVENREEVSQESDDNEDEIFEDEIFDNKVIDNRGVGDESNNTKDRIIEDGLVEDRIIEDMIAEDRVEVINEDREEVINDDREEAINTSNDIADRISEDGEEVINESNGPEDGIIENGEESDHESEDENDPLEPPFPALENRGGQADSPLRRHSSHILIIQWLEARRRRGLPELDL